MQLKNGEVPPISDPTAMRLGSTVYHNSRYVLAELLEGCCINKTEFDGCAFRYEKTIEKLIPAMPLSEERLALFLLAYLGADIHKPGFFLALQGENKKLLGNAIESLMGVSGEDKNHSGAKIIKELLGCKDE